MTSTVCDVDEALVERMRELRFRKAKTNAALIMKIEKDTYRIVEDEYLDDTTVEDLVDALPETSCRYVVFSYKYEQKDGRVSYPLLFIYYSPVGIKPEMHMMYASSKTHLVQKLDVAGKMLDIRKGEELTDEFLHSKLSFYK